MENKIYPTKTGDYIMVPSGSIGFSNVNNGGTQSAPFLDHWWDDSSAMFNFPSDTVTMSYAQYNAPIPVNVPFGGTNQPTATSVVLHPARESSGDDGVYTAMINLPQSELAVKKEVGLAAKPAVQVVNKVVTVDPYFDLEAELEMFSEVGLPVNLPSLPTQSFFVGSSHQESSIAQTGGSTSPMSGCSSTDRPQENQVNFAPDFGFCDVGVNTDLTQLGNLFELYQACYDFTSDPTIC